MKKYYNDLKILIQRLISIESINPPGNEEKIADEIENFFILNKIPFQSYPFKGKRRNIVVHLPGKSPNGNIAFTGHMDTVPVSNKEKSEWRTPPFEGVEKNGRLYGRGSTDMKAGLAAAMMAIAISHEKIQKEGVLPPSDTLLIITGDEEDFMLGSKTIVQEDFIKNIDFLIVCEPTDLALCTSGGGRTYGKIMIEGESGHGSQGSGVNVIHTAAKFIQELVATPFNEFTDPLFGNSFWQVLAVQAGQEPGIVPDELTLTLDARLTPDHPTEEIWQRLSRISDKIMSESPGVIIKHTIIDQRMGWRLKSQAFLTTLKNGLKASNITLKEKCFKGSTDGSILRKRGMESVIIGPGTLSLAHKANESVSLAECEKALELYFNLIWRKAP